ncbi:MAG: ACP S-malonyltransferase [Puniceicoccales bacterium]|jgi:[acyl-carrier-protein] S-malonyltransferase|nr:ACP S-malonyltransferase [Puniceicoccales bacterium]
MSIALMFPGQGAQYVGMGKSLCKGNRGAREIFSRAEKILGLQFSQICFLGPDEVLMQTSICQPALFVHGCAVINILREMGNSFDVAYGLSLGELTALWAAEVIDFEAGVHMVSERGRLMQAACEKTKGSMLCLLGGALEDVDSLCHESGVEIANINCPGQVVIAGETKNIQKAQALAEKMTFKRVLPLNVAGAYHSRLMESASVGFEKVLQNIEFHPPRIKILTNVTGECIESPEKIKEMLVRQIVSPVLFEKCCRSAMRMQMSEYFECGPKKTLCGMLKRINKDIIAKSFDNMEDFNCQ